MVGSRLLAATFAILAAVVVVAPALTRGTLAAMTATTTSASNQPTNTALVSPTGLTATVVANTSVTLSWTGATPNNGNGNGYAITGLSNGTSPTCPTSPASYTTWVGSTASSTTTFTDSGTIAKGGAGTFACYLVQTGYDPAGAPPWTSVPQWSSQGSLAIASVALGIAKRQSGSEVAVLSTSVTPTLPANSAAGDLLVAAIFARDTTTAFTGPTGWSRAVRAVLAGTGAVEIWYRANTAKNVSGATWSDAAASTGMAGAMAEFSGVATTSPLDATGSMTASTSSTSAAVSTSAPPAVNGDLVVTAFSASGSTTFGGSPAGWTRLFGDSVNGVLSDFEIGAGAASNSETVSGSTARTWVAAVATFD